MESFNKNGGLEKFTKEDILEMALGNANLGAGNIIVTDFNRHAPKITLMIAVTIDLAKADELGIAQTARQLATDFRVWGEDLKREVEINPWTDQCIRTWCHFLEHGV